MIRTIRPISTAVMVAGLTAALLAQGAPKINVKLGLWEITTTVTLSGDAPVDTSNMPPDQAARMKAVMGAMMGPHTNTSKSCLTQEKFNQGLLSDNKNCKSTIVTNTSAALDVQMDCAGPSGQGTMSILVHFEAPTPDTVKGSFKGTSAMGTQKMTSNGTTTGKWLGADCGDIK